MSEVERENDSYVVDAELLSRAFNLPADDVRARMKAGHITSRLEAGEGDDEGRWRITFYSGNRALRLTVDQAGQVLHMATSILSARRRSTHR
ncbi:MAG: DUF6522 family protein [Proteobacteria bacterium]|nr:DUF6522 family protein [Pseudomonadota bacterium]